MKKINELDKLKKHNKDLVELIERFKIELNQQQKQIDLLIKDNENLRKKLKEIVLPLTEYRNIVCCELMEK